MKRYLFALFAVSNLMAPPYQEGHGVETIEGFILPDILSAEDYAELSGAQKELEKAIFSFNANGVVKAIRDGADPNIKFMGTKPHIRTSNPMGTTSLMRLFYIKGLNELFKVHPEYKNKFIQTARALKDNGARLNIKDSNERTARDYAEMGHNLELYKEAFEESYLHSLMKTVGLK